MRGPEVIFDAVDALATNSNAGVPVVVLASQASSPGCIVRNSNIPFGPFAISVSTPFPTLWSRARISSTAIRSLLIQQRMHNDVPHQ
jgi:hypothetical protein